MDDATVTQLGLTVAYSAVAVLMTLTEHVERSKALRVWIVMFYAFAIDALANVLRLAFALPAAMQVISWLALTAAGVSGVVGTVTFLGMPIPKGLYALGATATLVTVIGLPSGVDPDLIRAAVFVCVGATFLWSAKLTFEVAIGGVGRWVIGSAFIGAGVYAILWPAMFQHRIVQRLEFFLDLSLVMWGAAGALLVHFERSRERVQRMLAKELELRAQLERSERLEALGRLAGGVAHDFNNVLTTVIHGSELALRQLDDRPGTAACVQTVLEAARGAAGFTRQLLALGRRRLPGKKPIRVNEALRSALGMVRPSLHSNHQLDCSPLDDSVTVAAGDGQVEQIVVNLALNAIDAMPDGGCLELRLVPLAERVMLSIRDTGCGMDEETLKRVFEPFFSTKSNKGGSGLGLAAVYAIVKQLDGQIEVTSTEGSGTCFTVTLPRCEPPKVPSHARKSAKSRVSPVRILVVDDQDALLRSLCASLTQAGYHVTAANCADEAMRRVSEAPPSLLLTDVCMPGKSGLELVSQLRLCHPQLPVIFMTGHANDEELESGKYGARWLLKPFTSQSLHEAIDAALTG